MSESPIYRRKYIDSVSHFRENGIGNRLRSSL